MARRGEGLVLRDKTWWLDFTFRVMPFLLTMSASCAWRETVRSVE